MNKTELEKLFITKYDRNEWIRLLSEIFQNNNFLKSPAKVFLNNEIAYEGAEIGNIITSDNAIVGVFDVYLKDNIRIDRNRVALRNLLKSYYNQIDGAFVVYHQDTKWRFSFISEIRVKDELGNWIDSKTEPKRYTYVLGENETVKTAVDRFKKLFESNKYLSDIKDAFSVEKVTKEFFDKYKDYYLKFSEYLCEHETYRKEIFNLNAKRSSEKYPKEEKAIRDFVKLLLGRIIFIQYLQKKGWMGCPSNSVNWENGNKRFLQNLFDVFPEKKYFYSECLVELFFNTLNNNNRKNGVFPITNSRVPYLNGGLFDEENPLTRKINFPESYFKTLLEFFDQYNFTIDENSPDDQEVGIDPEMLGHIFENLLEENRNKGAFYTPKDIVHYMCQESIIEYLKTHLGENKEIDILVRRGDINRNEKSNFVVKNAKFIQTLLDNVKVCDPAIGSGAFPMGILMEILKIKTALNLTLDRSEAKKYIIQNNIYGVDKDGGAVDIARLRFWLSLIVDEDFPVPLPNLDYKIMQGDSLLEQFEGIDLSKSAILGDPEFSVRETNIELFTNKVSDAQIKYTFDKRKKEELKEMLGKYFEENDKIKKESIRKTIDKIVVDHIDRSLEAYERSLKDEIIKYERNLKEKTKKLKKAQVETYNKVSKERKEIDKRRKILKEKKEARKKLIEFENTSERPYFLWHLYFSDVFEDFGFDIIIGNPPYIQLQKIIDEANILEKAKYETFTRTGDIYCLFYEQSINLLKPNGILAFITSNTWMRTKFGELLRKFFIDNADPIKLLNFEDAKIFQSVTVETNIIFVKKEEFGKKLCAANIKMDYLLGTHLHEYFRNNFIELNELPKESWVILSTNDFFIKDQIYKKGKLLKNWDIEFYRGILTGFNEAFFINEQKKNELIGKSEKNADIIKPLLRGREIKKFGYAFNNQYVIFSHNGLKENKSKEKKGIPRINVQSDYPDIYEHLLQYKDNKSPLSIKNIDGSWKTLVDRADQGDDWTNLRDCAYFDLFEKPKLIWLAITDKPAFAYDDSHYITAPAYFLSGDNLKYLLAVLNSKVIEWYLDKISSSTGQGTNQWSKLFIGQIPVPKVNDKDKILKYEIIADYLTFLNDETNPIINSISGNSYISKVFEDLLNMMVYELYFDEHMKNEEIDVLRFIDKKNIPPLSNNKIDDAEIIGKAYNWLQESDNEIRNRIILSNIKSKDIIRRINSSTH